MICRIPTGSLCRRPADSAIPCGARIHSVYELDQLDLGLFDHIAFRGIYYHLKSPLLAFEQLAKALKVGGRLYFEGEAAINYVEDLDGPTA